MCGISGMISGESISPITISRVEEMNNKLFHRGPDSSGLFSSENIQEHIALGAGSTGLELPSRAPTTAPTKARGFVFLGGGDVSLMVFHFFAAGVKSPHESSLSCARSYSLARLSSSLVAAPLDGHCWWKRGVLL